MTKGMKIALGSHLAGMVPAILLAWFVPRYIAPYLTFFPEKFMQLAALIFIIVWGIRTTIRIYRRQDPKGNRIIEHYDNPDERVNAAIRNTKP